MSMKVRLTSIASCIAGLEESEPGVAVGVASGTGGLSWESTVRAARTMQMQMSDFLANIMLIIRQRKVRRVWRDDYYLWGKGIYELRNICRSFHGSPSEARNFSGDT